MGRRQIGKLTPRFVATVTKPGKYGDGGNLQLVVEEGGNKRWVFRYQSRLTGKEVELGLGALHTVGLKEARDKARFHRQQLLAALDPMTEKEKERQRQAAEAAKAISFQHCAEQCITAHESAWKSAKHRKQWTATLGTYAYPLIGSHSVAAIDTAAVMRVMEQQVAAARGNPAGSLWLTRNRTAVRLLGRLESIVDWATVRGYREGANPARWRGHLDHLLPAPAKIRPVEHHAALAYVEIAGFITALRAQEGMAARCLEFVILTACRSGEALGARWGEIDLEGKTWTIPKERMKTGREHKVPLSPSTIVLLRKLIARRSGDYVFPGRTGNVRLAATNLFMLLRRMGRDDLTAHGFRSSFRDWAAERTSYPREVAEMALAHAIPDAVEAAYRRGDLFQKRARLMAEWAKYIETPSTARTGNVTAIGGH